MERTLGSAVSAAATAQCCHTVAPLKVLQASTKGLLSLSPHSGSGSLKENNPIPSSGNFSRGERHTPTRAHEVAA